MAKKKGLDPAHLLQIANFHRSDMDPENPKYGVIKRKPRDVVLGCVHELGEPMTAKESLRQCVVSVPALYKLIDAVLIAPGEPSKGMRAELEILFPPSPFNRFFKTE